MDRVFLDANVLFSAAWREDAGLLALWRLLEMILLTSQYAVDEAAANLPDGARQERLSTLVAHVTVGSATFEDVTLPAGIALPDDDLPILRAAVAMCATHLLTGDLRHFGPLIGRQVAGVRVLRPAEYLRRQTAT